MLNDIKVIGFDLDNTLYPCTPEIQKKIRSLIYEKISDEFNIPYETSLKLFEDFYSQHLSGTKSIKSIEKRLGHSVGERAIIQEAIEEADFLELINENNSLREMLSRLKSKREIDLITGSHYPLAVKKLNRIGIQDLFKNLFTHEDGKKHSGELYQKWIALTELPTSKLLYVGDNKKQDVDVPKSLGIQTCILGKYDNADFQIKNILDLENLFY
jgi:HAD superfamily hydrolase (TIGR01549 family)